MFSLLPAVLVLWVVSPPVASLQLYTSNSTFPNSTLSSSCRSALVAPINCDPTIQLLPGTNFAAPNYLSTICNATCSAALASYRTAVTSACTTTDVLVVTGTQYPPTFPVDYITYYYNAACLTANSDYCLDSAGAYYNMTQAYMTIDTFAELPDTMVCHPCFLQNGQLQLQSPYAYTTELATNWSSITTRCGVSNYTYVAPTMTIAPPTPDQTLSINGTRPNVTCVFGSYVIQAGDTCSSIQAKQSVSDSQIVALNGLDQNCTTISSMVGSGICLPQTCHLYTVQTNDTCSSIATVYNLTFAQVVSLNFQLDPACNTISNLVGSTICVGLTNYTVPTPTVTSVTSATAAAPTPSGIPVAPETDPAECGEWHVVVGGDTCNQLSINYQISLADLYQLNPMLNSNCSNLYFNYSYCVEGYNFTFTDGGGNGTTGPASWPPPTDITPTDTPMAPGTPANCSAYWIPVGDVTCEEICDANNITLSDFQAWNPSLNPNCDAALVAETYYCIAGATTTSTSPPPVQTPSNVAPGVVAGCSAFFNETDLYCYQIVAQFNITLDQFEAWNGGSNVCNALISGESYCVAGPSNATTTTTTTTTTSMSTSATPSPTTSQTSMPTPTNVASGVVPGCTGFFTETNLLCYQIVAQYNITLTQFEDWNGGASVCNVLISGEAYCIAGPAMTTTTAPATSTT